MKKEIKKEEILKVAENLFVEKGFEGTSVRELTKAAGVNTAMISYYFGSKEGLLEEIVRRRAGYSKLKLEAMLGRDELTALQKLEHIIDFYVDKVFKNRKYHLMLYRELTFSQRKDMHFTIMEIINRNWEIFRNTVNEGVKSGEFKPNIEIDFLILTVFGLINQYSRKELVNNFCPEISPLKEEDARARLKDYLKKLLQLQLI